MISSNINLISEDNFYKNCRLSNVDKIYFHISNVHSCDNYDYDIILANIDKKNIIKILDKYQSCNSGAIMILAGLLDTDLNEIKSHMKSCYIETSDQQDEWISLVVKNRTLK